MNVRAQAVGMASQTQNVAQAIVGQFFPIFLKVRTAIVFAGERRLTKAPELWILCVLHVRRHQLPAGSLRLV